MHGPRARFEMNLVRRHSYRRREVNSVSESSLALMDPRFEAGDFSWCKRVAKANVVRRLRLFPEKRITLPLEVVSNLEFSKKQLDSFFSSAFRYFHRTFGSDRVPVGPLVLGAFRRGRKIVLVLIRGIVWVEPGHVIARVVAVREVSRNVRRR